MAWVPTHGGWTSDDGQRRVPRRSSAPLACHRRRARVTCRQSAATGAERRGRRKWLGLPAGESGSSWMSRRTATLDQQSGHPGCAAGTRGQLALDFPLPFSHSVRSASTRSTRIARRAGTAAASGPILAAAHRRRPTQTNPGARPRRADLRSSARGPRGSSPRAPRRPVGTSECPACPPKPSSSLRRRSTSPGQNRDHQSGVTRARV